LSAPCPGRSWDAGATAGTVTRIPARPSEEAARMAMQQLEQSDPPMRAHGGYRR